MCETIKTLPTLKILRNPNPGNPQIASFERKSTGGDGKESKMGKNAKTSRGEIFECKYANTFNGNI